MENMKYVNGFIAEIKELTTKTGNPYKRITIVGEDETKVEASAFITDEITKDKYDALQEAAIFKFQITEKGIYKNITNVSDIEKEVESSLRSKTNEFKSEVTEPQHNNSDFYINLGGKTYVTQKGLLNEAHKKNIFSIETEMIDFKDGEIAIVKATAKTEDGRTFTGYGDATKDNVNKMIVKHLLRMAETRAINRSLRLLTNIGVTSIEELEN